MRKLQKPPVKEVKTSKKEPLAEGLQTIPIDSAGRRIWRKMSDEEVVGFAQKFMEENGITGKNELQKADSGLHGILKRRGLLGKIKFEEKQKSWKEISDEKVVELAKKIMGERGISSKMELKKADSGLYSVLKRRELLDEVGLEGKQKSWKEMGDTEIVEFVRKVMREKKIDTRGKLQKADGGLYTTLRRRELLDRIRFEEKQRSWEDMSDEEVIEVVRKVMREKKITSKRELKEADRGLYSVLRKRGLLEEVGFEERRRKQRSWKKMSDDEIVEFAKRAMEEKEIGSRKELENTDGGLYNVLWRRGLLDSVFANIEKQRTDQARDAVIDALTKFADSEKPEVGVA